PGILPSLSIDIDLQHLVPGTSVATSGGCLERDRAAVRVLALSGGDLRGGGLRGLRVRSDRILGARLVAHAAVGLEAVAGLDGEPVARTVLQPGDRDLGGRGV